ncbi:hypothetical protein [uncultured Metabacillus sp.]|uniref:hypothetical protein n=1 Tax=uncultured Metabacillus sp. TaxID=2860135 RepID=UPI002606C6CD|nr:hypothetical protein [uncultured Metabacillus sp.]
MNKDKYSLNEPTSNYTKLRQLDNYMTGHKGYIAGGVFKNIFNNENFKDVDIFFESERDYLEAVELFKKDDKYKSSYKNNKVTAYRNIETGVTVELIKHKFKSPLDMIDEFDFTITQFVCYKVDVHGEKNEFFGVDEVGYVEWKVAYHKKFFEHLHMKRLVIDQEMQNIILPVNTFNRMFRYARYGYFPCRETKAKIIEALRNVPSFSDEMLAMELYNGLD